MGGASVGDRPGGAGPHAGGDGRCRHGDQQPDRAEEALARVQQERVAGDGGGPEPGADRSGADEAGPSPTPGRRVWRGGAQRVTRPYPPR